MINDGLSSEGETEIMQLKANGNGIDIRIYAGLDGDYTAGFAISDNLYNFPVGYEDTTLTLTLPEDRTLDDVDGVSVWCVTVGVSFGDGIFQ